MVYLFALIGFAFGFAIGLGTINVILRNIPKENLTTDSKLRWKYGLLVWGMSFLGAWIGIYIFNHHF